MSVSGDSSGGMYVISGLMPSTNYSIQVAAETSAGTGPYSVVIHLLTTGMIKYILVDNYAIDSFLHSCSSNLVSRYYNSHLHLPLLD